MSRTRLNSRVERSVAEVTEALKARLKQQRQLLAMRERQQTLSSRPATKLDAKAVKLTFNTKNSLNAETLRTCPGGPGVIGILRMIDAEDTGCRLASDQELTRLKNSAKNCNTTRSNYLV